MSQKRGGLGGQWQSRIYLGDPRGLPGGGGIQAGFCRMSWSLAGSWFGGLLIRETNLVTPSSAV